MENPLKHFTLRATAALGVGAALALAVPIAANAHVSVDPSTTGAGSYTVLTFAMGHGCEGSPTTSVAIEIPEPILSVTPEVVPGWEVEKVMVPLDEPTESSHGEEATERVGTILYTADEPFPDGYRVTFDLSLQVPAEAEGDTLRFPALQSCVEGETDWADEDPEAEAPAPSFVVTGASGDGHGGGTHTGTDTASTTTDAGSANATGGTDVLARVLGVLGLVIGAIGIVFGITARRRPKGA